MISDLNQIDQKLLNSLHYDSDGPLKRPDRRVHFIKNAL
jgi:hypothetical protein